MKDDKIFLMHIRDAITKIEEYVKVGKDEFLNTSHWQDAVIRQLEVIGEATKNISNEFREKNTDIPWRRMAGLRDILIHEYMGVDIMAVWNVTQQDLPPLKAYLEKYLHKS
ncbi:DUF86 domain-containing protein [bacterium]|nr:DUF86 domain-containing protein [bacterium]